MLTAFSGEHDRSTLEQVVAQTRPDGDSPLGTFEYTNIGYNIAGLIVERETGRNWQEAVTEEVLQPLGLEHTSCFMSSLEDNQWPFAEPHSCVDKPGKVVRVDARKVDSTMHAAGGLITTARDMCRWLRMQLADGVIDGREVFPRDVIRASHQRLADCDLVYGPYERHGYGYGWYLGSYHGETVVHHFGAFTGAHAQIAFMPDHDMGVVVLVNEADFGGDLASLVSSYACDYIAGRADIESAFAVKLDSTRAQTKNIVAKLTAREAEIAKRTWMLELPFDRYAGTYRHPLYGTLHVDYTVGDQLHARLGVMKAVATPYPDTNAVRVDMPPGYGTVIRFTVDSSGVASANIQGMTFPRAN
jgi:CubicO group peptidase (beta-lactamase class C family)